MSKYIIALIAVEALTQLICKADIFDRPREWAKGRWLFIHDLLSCPYCVSVWSAVFVGGALIFWSYTGWFLLVLALHRMSNMLHDLHGVALARKINLILERSSKP